MRSPRRPQFQSELLYLLSLQPPARLAQIARHWGSASTEPATIYRHLIDDRARIERMLLAQGWVGNTQLVLVDMVQDHSLPVTLYRDDRKARSTLAEWGLIFPCPQEWGVGDPQHPNWSWTMPVEIAILCAGVVPIYRPRLPLVLGQLEDDELADIAGNLGVGLSGSHPERVLQVAEHLLDHSHLEAMLLSPDWYDHLFTLQIVLEWHGICHRQELFSFAWGDDTLRPLTARDQQLREQLVERDLLGHGLLYAYSPPEPDPDGGRTLKESLRHLEEHDGEPIHLLILPEELRLGIWTMSRQLQEFALRESLAGHGGWSSRGHSHVRQLDDEPVDRLKGLVCVIEANGYPPVPAEGHEESELLGGLDVELDPRGPGWAPLIELGQLTGVLVTQQVAGRQELGVGHKASGVLDGGPAHWATEILESWVKGVGPSDLDAAQNVALGLSEGWLAEVQPLVAGPQRRTAPLEAWWRALNEPGEAPGGLHTARRRHRRPTPSWLHTSGAPAELEVWCGNPRSEPDRRTLQRELLILEGYVTTFRLLILDVLGGFPHHARLSVSDLSYLCQDVAALALHLNLAVLLFDPAGQTYLPVRPPSFLVEPGTDELFSAYAELLFESLLAPAGVVEFTDDRQEALLVPDRIDVETPPWFDHEARVGTLASLTGAAPRLARGRRRGALSQLRRVKDGHVESDRRFWLGRPLDDLRRALAGRAVKALRAGYLEIG